MQDMFYGCSKLKYLDISSFTYNSNCDYYKIIYIVPNNIKIIALKSFYDKIKDGLPSSSNLSLIQN